MGRKSRAIQCRLEFDRLISEVQFERFYSSSLIGSSLCPFCYKKTNQPVNPGWFYMPQAGIEPTTLALGVLCSVHLSYWGNQEIIPNSCFSSEPLLYYKSLRYHLQDLGWGCAGGFTTTTPPILLGYSKMYASRKNVNQVPVNEERFSPGEFTNTRKQQQRSLWSHKSSDVMR